ncbi:hypothetical protein D6T63_09075 [Arthrobacter cheniae]|uniref:Uncharacterized protein n=1 Tax=Arthrobacter cheniae TaxID=1258888 RepID=A0A3A5M1X0_9MICC|nr:hypothetical protein [Arthrobacter cheniae]RJT80024.1 hypothetical protein D6T63_09075 [Arthrobacter cheniae]
MHRDGLFFDPLNDEKTVHEDGAPEDDAEASSAAASEPRRHHRPDAQELKAQRQRELARVQDDLKKMAQCPPTSGVPPRRRPVTGTAR